MTKMPQLLANDYTCVFQSPDPQTIYCFSPGMTHTPSGRLIATCDWGGKGVQHVPGPKAPHGDWGLENQGKIAVSDDRGQNWSPRTDFPLLHARPFIAGNTLYILGHAGDLGILRSDDNGDTWSEVTWLTHNQKWHQAPCGLWKANGKIYITMERFTLPEGGWYAMAPVVMAAYEQEDLTRASAWTFSNELTFEKAGPYPRGMGVPFHPPGPNDPDNPSDPRLMAPPAWLESNLVQFTDPDEVWYDPTGRTLHLWMRANTGMTNLACIAKAVEDDTGQITVSTVTSPAGEPMRFIPCPGGHLKFHILWDEPTKHFWLLSSQSTDSMKRPNRLAQDRVNLPNNERHRLALHFSRNCVDWCFAGLVTIGESPRQARQYGTMVVDEDDLHVLSRSGDHLARSAHDTNLITFHTVRNFRNLLY